MWNRPKRQPLKSDVPLQVTCLGGTTDAVAGGPRPVPVWPEDRERLAKDVEQAGRYAQELSCKRLVMDPEI